MKVDRVILSSNNNPLYYEFWNNISKTYKEKFGVHPTLIFFGSESDLSNANLSEEFGNIILQKEITDASIWQFTWSLFYFTKFFKDDVCAIMGIDQIPLGTYFLKDCIEKISDNNYVMLIDDQYTLENKYPRKWDEGGFSPSAYHIAKGQTFSDVFNFENTFDDEIKKLNNMDIKTMWGDKWGLDEAYSSLKLSEFKNTGRVSDLSLSKDFLTRRIDCHRNYEVNYDLSKLNSNFFIECHACRPYNNHKTYLDNMFNNIPKFI